MQIAPEVPRDLYDIPVDYIITEERQLSIVPIKSISLDKNDIIDIVGNEIKFIF